ncbi:hypothetical protein ACHAXN_001754 [Cyclotella atomus]
MDTSNNASNRQEVQYSWLPTLALGASSTVALNIRNASLTIPSCITTPDEKKEDPSTDAGISLRCRVEASVYLFGEVIQAAPIRTKCVALGSSCANFDALVRLPVRWRDLTRDAALVLNVFCSWSDCDGITGPSCDNASKSNNLIWGTTLPMFDSYGRLRQGLHKLKLYPGLGDGGMRYQNSSSGSQCAIKSVDSFLTGGFTPGIDPEEMPCHPFCRIDERKLSEDDPKWKASLILHELNRDSASTTSVSDGAATAGSSGNNSPTTQGGRDTSIWLDDLTRQRCMDVLNEQDLDDTTNMQQNKILHPTSSHRDTPYLIVELPTSPIPILHEEPIYPVESSSQLRGSTGSITANELIKFHSSFRKDNVNNAEETQQPSGCGNLNVPISLLAVETPNKAQDIPFAQSFLYPLVQTLDFEPPLADENEDNPFQDKYRILAHDLIRGLVDPGLKPDRIQRSRLERIINSPNHHLSTEEKDLLWKFRFSLVDNRRALTKFLLAVDWSVESEVVQAAELLEQWRKRSPIEVTDALKLLGRNVAFQTSLVRSYAIETLASSSDEELHLYLLQLVQALKYEEDVSGGTSGGDDAAKAFSHLDGGRNKSSKVSSLATFLIERASRHISLSNFLYWYLRVEMSNPIYEARYREVFISFQEKLSSVYVENGSIMQSSSNTEGLISLWSLLDEQEKFITGIMNCQQDSLQIRGKKDAKEAHLKQALEKYKTIPHAIPLPSAPHIFVKGVNPSSVRMFKSALYPAVVDFVVDHIDSKQEVKAQTESTAHSLQLFKVMVKTGDDLRQDQLVVMMIQLMDRLLKRGTLDLCLKPYSILAMPNKAGLVEFVSPSVPVSQILSSNNNSILAFFQKVAPQEEARYGIKPEVLQTYIRSCAGYCVLTYVLGVGDRHLDNIMIQPSDFGFIFGRDPKPLPPVFRLTKEMVDGMGGTESKEYRQFCSLACQAFNTLRKSAGLILNLLHLMSDAGIEDLSNNPSSDALGVISKVEERFKLELTDEQAESFFISLIGESMSALAPRVMEVFHQLSVARR